MEKRCLKCKHILPPLNDASGGKNDDLRIFLPYFPFFFLLRIFHIIGEWMKVFRLQFSLAVFVLLLRRGSENFSDLAIFTFCHHTMDFWLFLIYSSLMPCDILNFFFFSSPSILFETITGWSWGIWKTSARYKGRKMNNFFFVSF